jgi:hypothetical protein
MSDEAMRSAFEAWADEEAINNFHRAHCFDAWQAATLVERERAASVANSMSVVLMCRPKWNGEIAQALDDCACLIRKGEAP